MDASRRLRLLACGALALGVAAVATWRAVPLGPRLQIDVLRRFPRESFELYDVRVTAVGGEVIAEVRLEPLRGPVRVHPPGATTDLAPGNVFLTRVTVGLDPTAGDDAVPPTVRVFQRGRIERHYDVEMKAEPRGDR